MSKVDYVEQMKEDVQLVKSEDTDKILEKFEPETECKNCHFCYKGNPLYGNFRACMLQEKVLNEEVKGCYGGYRLKVDKHE